MTKPKRPTGRPLAACREWPDADRLRWESVCRPGERLRRGGDSRPSEAGIARRPRPALRLLPRSSPPRRAAPLGRERAADQVTPANVTSYLEELTGRVGSVTVYGSISKLRRIAELLNPELDLAWLRDIEDDLDLVKQPKSKMSKLVDTSVLVEVGLTLLHEAGAGAGSVALPLHHARRAGRLSVGPRGAADRAALNRAVLARDGLIVALLALCPIRLKNFAALELGRSLDQDRPAAGGSCSIRDETKSGRPDERPVPRLLTPHLDRYVAHHRAILGRGRLDPEAGPVWISAANGGALLATPVSSTLSASTTFRTLGVEIGPAHVPHLRGNDGVRSSLTRARSCQRAAAARRSARDRAALQSSDRA